MALEGVTSCLSPTTAGRWWALALGVLVLAPACRGPQPPEAVTNPQTLSRTEFTDRIENFFEHEPLRAGKPSRFLIHLTDLSDGSPVEKAEVTLTLRAIGGNVVTVVKARVGRVTGIYVADMIAPGPGGFGIEFHIKNPKLDEHMVLADFRAQ